MKKWAIQQAAQVLREGGIVAYPTEAVWGLGCDPRDKSAIKRLLALKQRNWQKGLIVIAAEIEQLLPYLGEMDDEVWQRVTSTWPGHQTWILPASPWVLPEVSGARETIAARVSAHPLVEALCYHYGGAIISTSANHTGHRAAVTETQLRSWFGKHVDFILTGSLGGEKSVSPIRDAVSGKVLREY